MTQLNSTGTALITGASSGIGAIYADRLAKRGYDLLLVARNAERLRVLAKLLAQGSGRNVEILVADLTNATDLRRVEARLRSDPEISMLVNNAGLGATGTLLESDPDRIEAMIQLNVIALTRLTQAAVPGFVAPELLNGSYSGSKAYVVNLSQSLHHEVSSKGVRVQAVLPGAIRTEFWDTAGMPVANLPKDMIMSAEDLVDAALTGLDAGELITIPSLPDAAEWQHLDSARVALGPKLSRATPADRYLHAPATH
jgi:short-subunit dehydrogenase